MPKTETYPECRRVLYTKYKVRASFVNTQAEGHVKYNSFLRNPCWFVDMYKKDGVMNFIRIIF